MQIYEANLTPTTTLLLPTYDRLIEAMRSSVVSLVVVIFKDFYCGLWFQRESP